MSARGQEPVILLLENDESDAFFFKRALAALGFTGQLHVVESALAARDYLEDPGQCRDREAFPLPDLIVSDLKMPGHTGLDFLDWIKTQNQYRELPFVMFSGSALPHERDMALKQGARAFFSKSGDFTILKERVRQILSYLTKPVALAPGIETQNVSSTVRNTQPVA
jgi:CheY-like chemotaxis protein